MVHVVVDAGARDAEVDISYSIYNIHHESSIQNVTLYCTKL